MLTRQQLDAFRKDGHVTVPSVFQTEEIAAAIADVETWSSAFLQQMRSDQADWFLDTSMVGRAQLRKLDNPVFHREAFRKMAQKPSLVEMVEQIIGSGVSVFFSQVFMKPPEGGGPKPIHQDNFYFGPNVPDAMLTVWVALDEATTENGCLYYGNGSHQGPVLDHTAPTEEPFNLQVPREQARDWAMTPAPVPRGGISCHHGNTLHQSSANRSAHPRRAVAMHYLQNDAQLVRPALEYDPSILVRMT